MLQRFCGWLLFGLDSKYTSDKREIFRTEISFFTVTINIGDLGVILKNFPISGETVFGQDDKYEK